MRLTLSSPEFVTHTSCLPSEIPLGSLPTGIVPTTTGSGLLSTRRTLSSPDEAIQVTFLAPATPSGALPTSSGSPIVLFVAGSMRVKVPSLASVTKTVPSSVTEMPSGPLPAGIEATTFGAAARRRSRWRSPWRWPSAAAVALAGGRRLLLALEHAGRREPGGDEAEHEHGREDDAERAVAAGGPSAFGVLAGVGVRGGACGAPPPPAQRLLGGAGELARRLVALVGVLRQRALDDARRARAAAAGAVSSSDGGGSLTWANIVADVRVAQERARAREREVEHAAERVDVGARVGVLALDLLGRE